MSAASMRSRLLRAGGFSALMVLAENGLRLVSNLIITRYLLPEAFGVMLFVTTLITGLQLFMDIGIQRSVLREPDGDSPHFLRVAWTMKLGRAAMISGLVWAVALAFALGLGDLAPEGSVYADPGLALLLALAGVTPLLVGAESTNRERLARQMAFGAQVLVVVAVRLITIPVMVGVAQITPSALALVAGMLAGSLLGTVLTHLVLPGPRMGWCRDRGIEDRLWRFGRFVMWSSGFTFLGTNADRLILGLYLGAGPFGLYSVAMIWVGAAEMMLNRVFDNAGGSGLGQIARTRPEGLGAACLRLERWMALACAAAALGCYGLGPWLLGRLYPAEFAGIGPMLQILALRLFVQRAQALHLALITLGHARALMWANLQRAVAICVALPLGYALAGLEGALLASALSGVVQLPWLVMQMRAHVPGYGPRAAALSLAWGLAALGLGALIALG